MEPLRVVVVGCGNIAEHGHLPAYQQAANDGLCDLVAVCDGDLPRAERLAELHGLRAFASVDELLTKVRPDVISVATPPGAHRDVVVRALDAGCHVLCEKPIALNLAQAREMVEAAERNGRLLSICFQTRYSPEVVHVRERLQAGEFGHVHSIRTWGGQERGLPFGAQRHRVATNGRGCLQHWTIHNLDIALWLLPHARPVTASAFCHQRLAALPAGWVTSTEGRTRPEQVDSHIEDFASAMLRLEGGTVITLEANWMAPPSTRPSGWEILTDRAAISIRPFRILVDDGIDWIDRTPTLPPTGFAMAPLMAGFLDRVRAGGPAPVSGAEILRIQATMDALYESDARRREVEVERSW